MAEPSHEIPPFKKAKRLTKGQLYKPPTNEELNSLKETEILFQSNLFRMQMEELISEVKVPETKKKIITKKLQELNNILESMPSQEVLKLADTSWLPNDVRLPVTWDKSQVNGPITFHKPTSVKVVGSFLLGTVTRPDMDVDLALEIPWSCRQSKDYLNFRYHHKRALYCAYLANQLRGHDLVEKVIYTWKDGDHMRPIVVLKLSGKMFHHIQVRLHPCLPCDNFKTVRLIPSRSNVRSQWFTGMEDSEETFPSTPHYNSALLSDMYMEQHLHCLYNAGVDFPGFKDGILLLKVWLRQRQLDKGRGSFSGFIVSMLVAYLLAKRVLSKSMSGYQVYRNTIHYLAGCNWTTKGITLCADSPAKDLPTIEDFHSHFYVVFLDSSGFLNLCANVTPTAFNQIKHQATLAMKYLDDRSLDGFECLFMTPMPFAETFDHMVHLDSPSQLKTSCKLLEQSDSFLVDHGGDYITACLPKLVELLHKGLGSRVHLIAVSVSAGKQWSISDDPPRLDESRALTFGLLLNAEYCSSVLEKGPEANTTEAEEFRRFWGSRAELRRFQDGSICEAVVWPGQTVAEKRLISGHIIKHVLKLHAGVLPDTVSYIACQLDPVLRPLNLSDGKVVGTGEEENAALLKTYNDFTKDLRSLKDFPLLMTSVQGTSAVLRYTEVFPPSPACVKKVSQNARVNGFVQIPQPNQPCPEWVPVTKVICHLEGSGKWPDDLAGIQRVKAAFHIRLAGMLHSQHGLVTSPTMQYVDCLKDGYAFRVEVAHRREIGLLKETRAPDGLKMLRDNPLSEELEQRTVMLPRLTSTLHGIQQQHSSFSASSRLAKRWVCAHLLSNHVPEECIDLLVAYLYLHPAPHVAPCSPSVGLVRFLRLLSRHDWQSTLLIVNLNNELQDSDYEEINQQFRENRSQLPRLFLATPTDRLASIWTRHQPTAQILQRLVVLANESLKLVTSQMLMIPDAGTDYKQVFRPPLDLYDVLIHLRPKLVPRREERVDHGREPGKKSTNRTVGILTQLPVVDFNPVKLYIQELERAYCDMALFFYDCHGGTLVGVVWNPNAFQPQEFKILQAQAKMIQPGTLASEELKVVPNIPAILEDFQVLGHGLVDSVEVRTEKWVI